MDLAKALADGLAVLHETFEDGDAQACVLHGRTPARAVRSLLGILGESLRNRGRLSP